MKRILPIATAAVLLVPAGASTTQGTQSRNVMARASVQGTLPVNQVAALSGFETPGARRRSQRRLLAGSGQPESLHPTPKVKSELAR